MNPARVCLACRRRIGHVQGKPFQCHSRPASFISFFTKQPFAKGEKPQADKAARQDATKEEESVATTRLSKQHDLLSLGEGKDGSKEAKIPPVVRKMASPASRHEAGDALESLFEETLQSPTKQTSQVPPPNITSSLEPYKNAEILKTMLAERRPLLESWAFFREHFSPNEKDGPTDPRATPAYLRTTGTQVLAEIIKAKRRNPLSDDLPTASQATKLFSDLGILRGHQWAEMMIGITSKLTEKGKLEARDEPLLVDLLASWNIVCRSPEAPNRGALINQTFSWSHQKHYSDKDILQEYRKHGVAAAFGGLMPQYQRHQLHGIPLVSIVTYMLLTTGSTDETNISRLVADARPLMFRLARVINSCNLESAALREITKGAPASLIEHVEVNFSATKELASHHAAEGISLVQSRNIREVRKASKDHMRPEYLEPGSTPFSKFIMQKTIDPFFMRPALREAHMKRDRIALRKLWVDAIKFPLINNSPLRDSQSQKFQAQTQQYKGYLTTETCNYFILIHMAHRDPERAIEVWNHMVKNNCLPDLRTWDSMLMGAKESRDIQLIEGVWSRMRGLGVKPDIYCWTTRISALAESWTRDAPNACIRAVDEMGREWLEAVKSKYKDVNVKNLHLIHDVDGIVKPTIVAINAAVAGLLKFDHSEAAQRILAWAGKYGISPDVYTYNTLLRPLIRKGQPEKALALLTNMQNQGIQADSATFTTIIDELFHSSANLNSKQQLEMMHDIFEEMDKVGVRPNTQIYAKVLYNLLQNAKGDLTAVNAVMQRMTNQGLRPTTQIYTMLAQHYFNQDPPHFAALQRLVERALSEVGAGDHLFWSIVIDGYVRVGDTQNALRHLGTLQTKGIRPKLETMTELLHRLVQNGEWDTAKAVVKNAIADRTDLNKPKQERTQKQQDFWNLAAELRLLD